MRRIPSAGSEHRSLALFALTLGVFLVTLNVTVVIVALPSLQADLGIRTDEAAWVIDAYNLVGASLLLCAGFLADRFGRKRMLCTGYAMFALGAARRRPEGMRQAPHDRAAVGDGMGRVAERAVLECVDLRHARSIRAPGCQPHAANG